MTLVFEPLDHLRHLVLPDSCKPLYESCESCGGLCEEEEVQVQGEFFCSEDCKQLKWGDK